MAESISKSIDDGGPAFPLVSPHGLFTHGGMSLRDWFAGQAMHPPVLLPEGCKRDFLTREMQLKRCAKDAYEIADAMLNEREKER